MQTFIEIVTALIVFGIVGFYFWIKYQWKNLDEDYFKTHKKNKKK